MIDPSLARRSSRGSILIFLAACSALAFSSGSDRAGTRRIRGIEFAESLEVAGLALELRGLAIKEATVFRVDVYAVALYCEPDSAASGDSVLARNGTKAVVLEFLRDVDRRKLVSSWLRDLSRNSGDEWLLQQASDLAKRLPDIRKGQRVTYLLASDAVEVLIEQETLGVLEGREAGDAVLAAFLGERAPRKLREDLLRPLDGGRQ